MRRTTRAAKAGNGLGNGKSGRALPDRVVRDLVRRILEVTTPIRIILFGSAARGTMGKESDVDLLVVVPTGMPRIHTAQKIYGNMTGVGVSKDIVVVTQRDVTDYGDDPFTIIHSAVKEGRVIYGAPP